MSESNGWLAAGGVGAAITACLFVLMAVLVDASDLVARMFRIFPLSQTEVSPNDSCAIPSLRRAITIEGVVGRLRAGTLQPLPDAAILSDDPLSGRRTVEVSAEGSFRFVAGFPDDAPAPCGDTERPAIDTVQHLVIRAAGCTERTLPVTRAWVPHTILLDCPARE